jgi:transcriptional regulator with XRE-family HTH domain
MSKSKNRTQGNDLGTLLRRWRGARNKSQMEASLDAGVSQRHLSFIEIGSSVPSRETLIGIAEALKIPYRDRNSLLLAAGYAPMYEDAGWDDHDMRSVTVALNRMLKQHEPYPALLMDRYWTVLQTNTAAPRFFNSFVDLSARPQPRNLLHLMFDPAGMRPFVANWEEVARTLIQRVYRESVGHQQRIVCPSFVAEQVLQSAVHRSFSFTVVSRLDVTQNMSDSSHCVLASGKLLVEDGFSVRVNAVDLEHVLRQIDPDGGHIHGWALLLGGGCRTSLL